RRHGADRDRGLRPVRPRGGAGGGRVVRVVVLRRPRRAGEVAGVRGDRPGRGGGGGGRPAGGAGRAAAAARAGAAVRGRGGVVVVAAWVLSEVRRAKSGAHVSVRAPVSRLSVAVDEGQALALRPAAVDLALAA